MKNIKLFRFLKYTCVGAAGTAFQYMILILLVSTGSTGPVAASSVGAIFGAIINYILNYHFTFRSRENHSRSAPRFFFVAITGFCVNWVSMTVTFLANTAWTFNPKQ
jgi:putative flippase GtrA